MLLSQNDQQKIQKVFRFSKRELEIVLLLCNGIDSTQRIAELLKLSRATIKVYLQRIYSKTQCRTKLTTVLKVIDFIIPE